MLYFIYYIYSANIEALAKDGESSSGKEKCNQVSEDNADPINETRCSDRDSSVQAYWKIYTGVKGSGSNDKGRKWNLTFCTF